MSQFSLSQLIRGKANPQVTRFAEKLIEENDPQKIADLIRTMRDAPAAARKAIAAAGVAKRAAGFRVPTSALLGLAEEPGALGQSMMEALGGQAADRAAEAASFAHESSGLDADVMEARRAAGQVEFDPVGVPKPKARIISIADDLRRSSASEVAGYAENEASKLRRGVPSSLTIGGKAPVIRGTPDALNSDLQHLIKLGEGKGDALLEETINRAVGEGDTARARGLAALRDRLRTEIRSLKADPAVGVSSVAEDLPRNWNPEATPRVVPTEANFNPEAMPRSGSIGGSGVAAEAAETAAARSAISEAGFAAKAAQTTSKVGGILKGVVGGAVAGAALLGVDLLAEKEQGEYHSEDFFSRALGDGSSREAVGAAFQDRNQRAALGMRLERLRADMAGNTVRLASLRPDLYNQLVYGRMLPKGAIPIGGQPDDQFLQQIALAMSTGAMDRPMTAEQAYQAGQ